MSEQHLNICNICGANYEYHNGRWVCPACGAYKSEEITNEEVTLLYTAAQRLRMCDFDEAENAYADIVAKYPENSEAYWGRMLSRYGIKYEDDFDGKKIPTCYAASIAAVTDDPDYARAMALADAETKAYYEEQAEYVERVRKIWIEKASKEKPYDIFISYKDTDNRHRTEDSVAAQELYAHLMQQGYRVFYSRESLRDKAGEKYEPYIFNALATAKMMIVYGSSPDYITSTWLKNEWTRYSKRMENGEKRPDSLIVACAGFEPALLPTALSSKQCLDATAPSFYSDIDKNIDRILHEKDMSPAAVAARKKKKKITISAISALVAILLACGIIFVPMLFGEKEEPIDPYADFSFTENADGTLTLTSYKGKSEQVDIPGATSTKTVTVIGSGAFEGKNKLTSVTIPESVVEIGPNAFYGCTSIEEIYIPKSVVDIGVGAFYGWADTQSIMLRRRGKVPDKWNSMWNDGCSAEIVPMSREYKFEAPDVDLGEYASGIVADVGETIILPKGIEKQGYIFSSWRNTKTDQLYSEGYEYIVPVTDAGFNIFQATWVGKPVTIRFNANGGEGSMKDRIVTLGESFEMISNKFTRKGYTFDGWATSENGPKVCDDKGNFSVGNENGTTLYAVWKVAPSKVIFHINYGTEDVTLEQEIYRGNFENLNACGFYRGGYNFLGWATTPIGAVEYIDKAVFQMGQVFEQHLFAIWSPITVTVNLDANGGEGSMSGFSVVGDEQKYMPACTLTREGYTFSGWSRSTTGTAQIPDRGAYKPLWSTTDTLYAIWTANSNKIIYNSNGGSGRMTDTTIKTGEEGTLRANSFTRAGYTFIGWATTPTGSVAYADKASYTMGPNASYTLYAVWDELSYSVTYNNIEGAVNPTSNPTKVYYGSAAVTLASPTKPYYNFVGWYSDPDFVSKLTSIPANPTANINLYAKWEGKSYTIAFNAGTGFGSMSNMTVKTGDTVTLPACSFSSGSLQFVGWGTESGGNARYSDKLTFEYLGGDLALYAVWREQLTPTEGLFYSTINGGTEYEVIDIGTATATDIVIPSTYQGKPVTRIGDGAFKNVNITSVIISEGITEIGDFAFASTYIRSVELPTTLKTIGASAFENLNSYIGEGGSRSIKLALPYGVTTIGAAAFRYAYINNIVIPGTIKRLPTDSFNLKTNSAFNSAVIIEHGVTSIASKAIHASSVYVPTSVISIDSESFDSPEIIFAEGSRFKYVDNCLINTATKTLIDVKPGFVIPADGSVITIAPYALSGNKAPTELVIPEGVTRLEQFALHHMSNTKIVTLPSTIKYIGDNCFAMSINLKFIRFNGTEAEWKQVEKTSQWNTTSVSVAFLK